MAIRCPHCNRLCINKNGRCNICGRELTPIPNSENQSSETNEPSPAQNETYVCPECGSLYSIKADACPVCGLPKGQEKPEPKPTIENIPLITCPECESQIPQSSKTCPMCGNPLAAEPVVSTPTSPSVEEAPKPDYTKFYIIGAVVAVVIIAAALLLYTRFSDNFGGDATEEVVLTDDEAIAKQTVEDFIKYCIAYYKIDKQYLAPSFLEKYDKMRELEESLSKIEVYDDVIPDISFVVNNHDPVSPPTIADITPETITERSIKVIAKIMIDGSEETIVYELTNENGVWKITDFNNSIMEIEATIDSHQKVLDEISTSSKASGFVTIYKGEIDGKYKITMTLIYNNGTIEGSYYYDKYGPNNTIKLVGSNNAGYFTINELNPDGSAAGRFELMEGRFDRNLDGEYINVKGKSMSTVLIAQ